MPLNAHEIAQQRHLKRHLSFWRFMAVLAIIIGLLAVSAVTINNKTFSFRSNHIATIKVEGVIEGDERLIQQLTKIEKADHVKGLIVQINSPGGGVKASDDIYLALRKIAERKPVAAVMQSVAASGGYLSAIGSDKIFASGNTITGSIGVIYSWPEYVELLNKVGVKMQEVKSSPLKASPNPATAMTDDARKQMEIMVKDSYDWFVNLVMERRSFDMATTLRLANGRIFSGRQALVEKLIDSIGDTEDAKKWVVEELKKDDANQNDLNLIDWTPNKFDENPFSEYVKMSINNGLGVQVFNPQITKKLHTTGLMAIMSY